jgi:hypothetical protein
MCFLEIHGKSSTSTDLVSFYIEASPKNFFHLITFLSLHMSVPALEHINKALLNQNVQVATIGPTLKDRDWQWFIKSTNPGNISSKNFGTYYPLAHSEGYDNVLMIKNGAIGVKFCQ